jgi:stage V sporulation protein R
MARVKDLSPELKEWHQVIRKRAKDEGLDFFEVVFEMVDYNEVNEIASLGGFPTRYPHWRFGMEYDKLSKSYAHGLSKIYEMVINTDPCYAYLLTSNSLMEQKLVMAHVYGHSDFFKHNQYFGHTNRRMLDEMANHAVRIREYQENFGVETVEEFIDRCLSLDNLIDHNYPIIKRQAAPVVATEKIDEEAGKARGYLDKFSRAIEAYRNPEAEGPKNLVTAESKRIPESPERDVLQFLLSHAPLEQWQRDVLSIIRSEAYYFMPQGQTKIMNEGWASYWHAKLMTEFLLSDSEVIDFADVHSGTLATPPGGFNPYKIGYELFHNIEERWNLGQFGKEWEECNDYVAKERWNKKTGLGRKKIFEVRALYNDVTFIDEFFTEDFCRKQKFFTFAKNERSGEFEIDSREFEKVKAQLITKLTNFGQPIIEVIESNYLNRGELLLEHRHSGQDLRIDYVDLTLRNLNGIWRRPVHLASQVEGKKIQFCFDGKEFVRREMNEISEATKRV